MPANGKIIIRVPLTHPNNVYFQDVNTAAKSPSPAKEVLYSYDPFFEANPGKVDGQFSASCHLLSRATLTRFVTGADGDCVYSRSHFEETYTFTLSSLIVAGSTLGISSFLLFFYSVLEKVKIILF